MDVISLTQQLVQVPSESSDPIGTAAESPEKGVVAILQAACEAADLAWETPEALPGRNNFLVRLKNPGAPRLIIMAHMDTVSARGMAESFSGALRGGRVYGRGACDDKGPLATVLVTLIELFREKVPLAFDVVFAATVDEECSMAGALHLSRDLEGWDLCIGLEPTGLRLVHAHKGVYRFRLHTTGRAAHSSAPEKGANAIDAMLPVLSDLQAYGEKLAACQDPEMGRAALSITLLQGGSSLNIIPDTCSAGVDIRLLPDMEPGEIARQVGDLVGDRARVEEVYQGAGIRTDPGNSFIHRLQSIMAAEGVDPNLETAAFATDCSKMGNKGPCVVWGPGDIAQAHKREEYIDVSQLEKAGRILRRFLTAGLA